jgi:hypothetical protein
MYHKISSLMLNIAKSESGHKEVFVAQPDGVTEKLAGKIFILLELEGKKNEVKKIMEFLIEGIDEYYYQDEKIFLRDKIEGLELENIFEAFLTKLNRALIDFLLTEKIKVKSSDFNITLGLIFENKLFFSSHGRNKAFLIFRKQDQYEIVNIETNVEDSLSVNKENLEEKNGLEFKIFSSVINGEIPPSSYFFFTNEVLPEYLSNKEMLLIITKLPPMVAAEQMKQSLFKVNSFVPFLGIIIKNTMGLSEQDEKQEILENLSAQNSISSLNYTEKKTEAMLSPAGLININKLKKNIKIFFGNFANLLRRIFSLFSIFTKKSNKKVENDKKPVDRSKNVEKKSINIRGNILVARSSSLPIKLFISLKRIIVNLFSRKYWQRLFSGLKNLHFKRKILLSLIIVAVLALVINLSIVNKQKKLNEYQEYFDSQISSFQDRYNLIDSYLLYDNEEGVKIIIGEISDILNNLEAINKEQEETIAQWQEKLALKRKEVQRLFVVEDVNQLFDVSEISNLAEPRNLLLRENNIYMADPSGKIVYIYNTINQENSSILLNASNDINLENPIYHNNLLYYLNGDNLISLDPLTEQYQEREIVGLNDRKTESFDIYPVNNLLYTLHSSDSAILRHSPASAYTQSSQWLQEEVDLSQAVDMAVTSEIWVLKNNAELLRLNLGLRDRNFKLSSIDPPLNKASKLIALDNLYILDLNSSRLVVFSQTGEFINQYEFSNLDSVYDLIIDEENNLAYILSNTSLLSFSLSQ